MLAIVNTGCMFGIEAVRVSVEVDVSERGFPILNIVGLPNKSVDEAKERVRSAIAHAGFEMPDCRITVNLAPADVPKQGSLFDLPIALGILAGSKVLPIDTLNNYIIAGELSLDGSVRAIPGIISLAIMAHESGVNNVCVPIGNVREACAVKNINVYGIASLAELVSFLRGDKTLSKNDTTDEDIPSNQKNNTSFDDVIGQEVAKRALTIAATGFHNVHLKGPPGTGKTMIARAFPSILPPMTYQEVLEVSRIYSSVGLLKNQLVTARPFRSPHHTTSLYGLVGGGSNPRPGEISLAHRGVLFLDEFPEFSRGTIEALRQPMEDGHVTIVRLSRSVQYPSRFQLIATSNPCPCGFYQHPKKACQCTQQQIQNYQKRISGPILDRIDIHVTVQEIAGGELTKQHTTKQETKKIQEMVVQATERQIKRNATVGGKRNAELQSQDVRVVCKLSSNAEALLQKAEQKLHISTRAYFKIIKVAQTIADIEASDTIEQSHMAEALQYR